MFNIFKRKYKYKVGEIIICIDDLKMNFITINKDYIVKKNFYSLNKIEYVKIIHDYDLPIDLPISLFTSKKECRMKKLIKLKIMKIQTIDCVIAITNFFLEKEPNNIHLLTAPLWKRVSKSGTGNNIVRTFENKKTGTIVNVTSSETQIFNVSIGPAQPMTIKSYIKQKYDELGCDFDDIHYEILGEDNVKKWPQVLEDPDDKSSKEPLDMENFGWLSIDDNELVISCGGDWQEPLTLTIKLINGQLTVTHKEDGFDEGISEQEFINSLN
jgi:hypothetical protein